MLLNFTTKILHFLRIQYTLFLFFMVALLTLIPVHASQNLAPVELSSLSGFDVEFAPIQKTEFINGQSLIGEVNFKPGVNYTVLFAFDVQQVRYLYPNGSMVEKGATIASVEKTCSLLQKAITT